MHCERRVAGMHEASCLKSYIAHTFLGKARTADPRMPVVMLTVVNAYSSLLFFCTFVSFTSLLT